MGKRADSGGGASPKARVEALIVTEGKDFSGEQRGCFDQVAALLESIANEPWEPPPEARNRSHLRQSSTPLVLDPVRRNRVVLIDGMRGSGKTTVFLGLLYSWSMRLQGQPAPLLPKHAQGPVFPLPIIDLHPLPERANLAMAVLGRLHSVAQQLEQDVSSRNSVWSRDLAREPERNLTTEWRDLVDSFARWHGGAELRSARLAPDEFALQLSEEAQSGWQVEGRLKQYVDLLVAEIHAQRKLPKYPILLVPIDDADMNPQRATELLELLRMFYHPRLVFLLTGDSGLFLASLRAHYLGDLWKPLHALPAEARQVGAVGPGTYAVQLATEVYDRVIPPSQRIRIHRTAVDLFKLRFPAQSGELAGRSLVAELAKMELYGDESAPDTSWLHFFVPALARDALPPAGENETEAEKRERKQPYIDREVADAERKGATRLRELLPDRLRGLLALMHGLVAAPPPPTLLAPEEEVERMLLWLWQWVVHEENVYPRAKDQLLRVLRPADCRYRSAPSPEVPASESDVGTSMKRVLLIACDGLRTSWDYRELHRYAPTWAKLPTSTPPVASAEQTHGVGLTVALRSRVRTRMRFHPDGFAGASLDSEKSRNGDESEPAIWLADRTVAALKLATDVIAMRQLMPSVPGQIEGEGGFVGGRLVPGEFEGAFVRVNGTSATIGRDLRYVWRVPRWDSFLDFDLFQDRWEHAASRAATVEAAARAFALLVVAVSCRQDVDAIMASGTQPEERKAAAADLTDEHRAQLEWRRICRAAKAVDEQSLINWSTRRRDVFVHWRDAILPCFCYPESGLSDPERGVIDQVVQEVLFSDPATRAAKEQTLRLERRRHLRAVIAAARKQDRAEVTEGDVQALLKELDDGSSKEPGSRGSEPVPHLA